MGPLNTESAIAKGFEYFGFAYLTQAAFQGVVNRLAKGDLNNAIKAKCGAAGASNGAALETQLLSSNPMTRFWRIPVSRMGTLHLPQIRPLLPWAVPLAATAAVGTGTYLFENKDSNNTFAFSLDTYLATSLFSKTPMPYFAGPKNPFFLTYGAAGFLGEYLDKVDQANKIEDPVKRKTALDAIGNSDLYWATGLTGAAFSLADYHRGWAVASRVPGLSRWSALGSNSPYQKTLADVSSKIECNSESGTGKGEEAADEEATAEAAAPETGTDAARMSLGDLPREAIAQILDSMGFVSGIQTQTAMIPDSALIPVDRTSLARASLAVYGRASNPVPSASHVLGQGLSISTGNSTVITPVMTVNYTIAPVTTAITSFTTSMSRPIFVLEPAALAE